MRGKVYIEISSNLDIFIIPKYQFTHTVNLNNVNKNCKDANRNEPNCVGFAREKAQTMSFVERGFERLGLDHQVVGFS